VVGRIAAFDQKRGRGEITASDGRVYAFHSTAIADGTRNIAVGTEVEFEVVPAQLGTWEAAAVAKR